MTLRFCKRCKTLLRPYKTDEGLFLLCNECGLLERDKGISSKEKIKKKTKIGKGVIKGENKYADYENICEKCGYDKAQIIDKGIFYSDEDNLILLKCGKCGWSERIGRKVS